MEKWGNRIILVLVLSYLIGEIFTINFLSYVNTALTILTMIITIIFSKRLPKLFSVVMVVIGSIILFSMNPTPDLFVESITKNLPLVCLIIIVPVLSVPIHLGKYNNAISGFLTKLHGKPSVLYTVIYGFFYLLTPITNLGSIHIIHSIIKKLKLPDNFLLKLYPRAFTSINTWAPYFASVFLVLFYLEIPIYKFIPYGLILSFFQFSTAVLLFYLKEKKQIKINMPNIEGKGERKRLIELLVVLLLLLGIIFAIEPNIPVDSSILIIITSILFSFIWAIYLKKGTVFLHEIEKFKGNFVNKQSNEIALFLTAGFFGVSLTASPISSYINTAWFFIGDQSFILLTFFTIVIISVFSFLGIHQIVIISSLLASVSPELLGIHDITFAMILLSSWAIGSMISPIAPVNVIVSNVINVNVFKVIFNMNILYTAILTFVHTIIIYIVHVLL